MIVPMLYSRYMLLLGLMGIQVSYVWNNTVHGLVRYLLNRRRRRTTHTHTKFMNL